MPSFSLTTPLGYIGLLTFGLGVFLILAGFDIVKVEKVSVRTGRVTWIVGILFAVTGIALFFSGEGVRTRSNETPALEPTASSTGGLGAHISDGGGAPESTAVPTIIPTVAQSQYERLAEAKTWPMVLLDGFENNDNQWEMWNLEDDIKVESTSISEGVFKWGLNLKQRDYFFLERAPVAADSDFYYAARVRRITDPSLVGNQAAWGLFFRSQGFDGIAFRLNDSRQYSVMVRKEGSWTSPIPWTATDLTHPGQFDDLGVIAEGTRLTFFINGVLVGEVDDSTFSSGNFGFIAGLNDTGVQLDTEFDDFELHRKP